MSTLALIAFSQASQAGNRIQDTNAAVGASVMVREVVRSNLLGGKASAFNSLLKKALENVSTGDTAAYLTSISCDSALGGNDFCRIHVYDVDHEGQEGQTESSFDLVIKVRDGKVLSATIENLAG
jgi:hypothetical protein